MEQVLDIFIIGGGINGAGIAADAAGRGLSVTLCDQSDLAAATSSASSKLIHGGLRYLEQYEFKLVQKALKERAILLHKAPHLITPLEFVLPHDKQLRPVWLIRLGLFIYDHLAAHPLLPSSKKINLRKNERGSALLNDFKTGFSYFDCRTDDARLVIANAQAAQQHGATILTHTRCVNAIRSANQWQITLQNTRTGEQSQHYAKTLINAAGPWIGSVQPTLNDTPAPAISLIKGSHIVIPKLYAGDYAYLLQNVDKRIVFVIPYQNDYTLIGTTDVNYQGSLDDVKNTAEETRYLCNAVNHYFQKSITPSQVVWSYAGVRCLQENETEEAAKITRDYKFDFDIQNQLLTIISGKLTTYRRLAEDVLNQLRPYFSDMKPAWTETAFLPGGDFSPHSVADFLMDFKKTHPWLPEELAERYVQSYGTRARNIVNHATQLSDLGEHFGAGLYQSEVIYLIQNEWAHSSEDILWRRSKLGLTFSKEAVAKLEQWLSNNR